MPQGQSTAVPDDGLTTRERRQQPLLMVHTGDGKGKSTAAFGLAIRAWNQGWDVGVFQFVKHLYAALRQACGGVPGKAQQRQLDDAVFGGVQPGGFGVEHQHLQRRRLIVAWRPLQLRLQAAQHAVVRVLLQLLRQCFGGLLRRGYRRWHNGSDLV